MTVAHPQSVDAPRVDDTGSSRVPGLPHMPDTVPTSRRPAAPLTVTVTPSALAAYGQCPLYFQQVYRTQDHSANRAIQRGQYVHRLADTYTKSVIDGRALSVDAVLSRVPVPAAYQDGADEERAILDTGREALIGYISWLDAQEFAQIISSEQYIRTPRRAVRDVPGAEVVFSGRADLTCLDKTGMLVVADLKATSVAGPDELLASPSSWVYRHLAAFAHAVEDIEIVQIVPTTGQSTRVRLGSEQIEAGATLVRALCRATVDGQYPPIVGQYCSYCDYVDRCPAHSGRPGITTVAF